MKVAEPPSWDAFCVVEVTSDPKDAEQVGGVWVLTDKDGNKTAVAVAPKQPVASAASPTAAQPSATPAAIAANTTLGGQPPAPSGGTPGPSPAG